MPQVREPEQRDLYQAVLPYRPPSGGGFASVRVEAWDADGNRIDQVITRAWRLPTG